MNKIMSLRLRFARCAVIALAIMIGCLLQYLSVPPTAAQSGDKSSGKNNEGSNDNDVIAPGKNLVVMGVPKIPKSLATQVRKYTGAFGLPVAGWHPSKSELWLKSISSDVLLSRVESGSSMQRWWVYINEAGVYDVYLQPQAKYLLFNKDINGDENFQMYLYDIMNRKSTLISDGRSRNTEPVWSHSGEQVIYSYAPYNGEGVSLSIINPFDPKSNRLLVQSTGNYLKAYDWSPDDRQAVFCEFYSNVASRLWLIDTASGEKKLLSPERKNDEYYGSPKFSRDGKGIYVRTDRDSEFKQLAYVDLHTGKFSYLSDKIKWDVDEFKISPDGRLLAFTTNEDGISRLYLLDTNTKQQTAISSLPLGIVSDLKWHNNSTDLAFDFKSPRAPNDVYVLNAQSGQLQLWAKSFPGNVELDKLVIPELIHWKSFDGRAISGFLYRPPSIFTGKRPVIIDIHGGPEEQYRPEYGYRTNYFINELGIARIYPNIRGSSGYGKTFLNLDNGLKREDAVKDVGALLDWIKTQPDLDSERVMVEGASYGGYIALSVAMLFSNRIRAAISDCSPSNLATMVEGTSGWRRNIQRLEFGDERNTKIRTFMQNTAPVNNLNKIKNPLLFIQGKNDPRVPVAEFDSIVQVAQRLGMPIWYLLGNDEGHGFVKMGNIEFRHYSIILFVKEYLLK